MKKANLRQPVPAHTKPNTPNPIPLFEPRRPLHLTFRRHGHVTAGVMDADQIITPYRLSPQP